jgi:GT2 family glycosyltransferase
MSDSARLPMGALEEVRVPNAPSVYVILINWNGEDDTCRCLDSLTTVDYPNMHVVISDNGSRTESVAILKQWAQDRRLALTPEGEALQWNPSSAIRTLSIVENGRNLGFTGANTVGIRLGIQHGADYVLFLNNDTVVTPTFLSKLVEVAEAHHEYGLLGCKTYLGDGPQSGQHPVIWSLGGYAYRFGNPMNLGSNQPDRPEWRGVRENDLICGCCMLIRRATIEQCGVQDDHLFFAIDDVEYSLRASHAGWKNALVLDAQIYHAGSRSVEGRTGLQLYYLFRNTYYFRTRYFPWHQNIVFFIHHLMRYVLVGGLGRLALGRGSANKGMWLGLKDFVIGRMGECPHSELLKKRPATG